MEYDRALYRVYEKILEDLNASPPLSSLPFSSSVGAARQNNGDADGNSIPTTVPYFLPLPCATLVDVLVDTAHTRNGEPLRRAYRTWRSNLFRSEESSSSAGAFAAAGAARARAAGALAAARRHRRRRGGGHHVRLSTDDDGDDRVTEIELPTRNEGSGLRRRAASTSSTNSPDGRAATAGGAAGGSDGSHSSSGTSASGASGSSSDSRPGAADGSGRAGGLRRSHDSDNDNDNESTSGSEGEDFDDEFDPENGDENVTASAAAAQRASRGQSRRNHRSHRRSRRAPRRRRGGREAVPTSSSSSDDEASSGDESSPSTDDDDGDEPDPATGGGCTKRGVYAVLRLSFFLGVLHLWALYILHRAYVGGGVRYRQNEPVALGGDDGRKLLGVTTVKKGDDGEGDDAAAQRRARTCIEYALATRPPEARSEYFHRYGDSDDKAEKKDTAKDAKAEEEGEGEGENSDDGDGKKRLMKGKNVATATAAEEEKDETKKGKQQSKAETKKAKPEPPLLGRDEVLQIKILYGGKCTGQCSRVRTVVYPAEDEGNSTGSDSEDDDLLRRRLESDGGSGAVGEGGDEDKAQKGSLRKGAKAKMRLAKNAKAAAASGAKNSTSSSTTTSSSAPTDPFATPAYWKDPHYTFATSDAIHRLSAPFRHLHNVTVVNVTVTERCLSTGRDDGPATFSIKSAEVLSQIYGMNSAVINQLMYGIRTVDGKYRDGYIKNMDSGERWNWHRSLLEQSDPKGPIEWALLKAGIMTVSLLSFFLITSITCLIVRVLTSSGVVLMFPLFAFFRNIGLPGAASDRIIGLSYPWIGIPQQAMVRRGLQPAEHLINAHLCKMFLYYIMYEGCQAAWGMVLYGKSVPAAMPVWIYGFAMMWEYFSMVFVRSALSAYFFPRMALLHFILYHLYFHSVPYGYFDVALVPLFLFMVQTMAYTLLALEVPASRRGVISAECPREVYNRLSWPEWSAGWPHEWTVFLPLNSRNVPLYDREVVDEDNMGEDDGGGGGDEPDDDSADERDPEDDVALDGGAGGDGEDDATTTIEAEAIIPLGSDDTSEGRGGGSLQRRAVSARHIV